MIDNQFQIAPVISPEQTMEIVLQAINELVSYELAVVLSLESEKTLKVRKASGPLYKPELNNYLISLDKHKDIAEIIERGEVFVFDDDVDNNEIHLDTYDSVIELPAGHSCLVAPLTIEDNKLGILTLDHTACDMFTPQVVKITQTLSKLISLALAHSVTADSLLKERDALIFERNSLLDELSTGNTNLIGNSPVWLDILNKTKLIAPTDLPVMIGGETGTGKEQIARAIHFLSPRSKHPFVALNCSALASGIAESELFGHEKGAFTGAISMRKGRFELADKGTLFLDEVGDLPLDIQPKLLRALQEGTFERVGGEASVRSDVRIICATHIDLKKAVEEGKFREDLYYRLSVFPIHLPPLRSRGDDIVLLSNFFLTKISRKHNKPDLKFSAETINCILSHNWPGNVRELQNSLERAAILAVDGIIRYEHLSFETGSKFQRNFKSGSSNKMIDKLDDAVKRHIISALNECNGKIYGNNGAAKLLGLKPTTLQSKIKKFGISS